MKIVVAIDKFKGSATSAQLARAIESAIKKELPLCKVVKVPIADGGDGTMLAIKEILGEKVTVHKVKVHRPLPFLKQLRAQYLLDEASHTAYMDLATASGLALVPPDQRDIMSASTLGTGEMIADAIIKGARHIVLGLGGSATCDGGMGLLSAMGCCFANDNGKAINPCASSLRFIKMIDTWDMDIFTRDVQFTLLTDVNNPLLGPNGAAAVFAPQKGATPHQVTLLEQGLRNFSLHMPTDVTQKPGAGAAGGVAAGMMAFLNATVEPGIDWILNMAHFERAIANALLIITGEGRIDNQTSRGKAPAGVLRAATLYNIPVIALCGSIDPQFKPKGLRFSQVICVTPPDMPLEKAMDTRTTLANVRRTIRNLIASWE